MLVFSRSDGINIKGVRMVLLDILPLPGKQSQVQK